MNLTARQTRFVEEYAIDHNGAAAAIRAGYAPGSAKVAASRLLTNDNVREAIEAQERAFAAKAQVTKEDMLAVLLNSISMARGQGNPMAMISAVGAICKLLGLYAPETRNIELSANDKRLMATYEAMSDGELMAIIAGENAFT